MTHLAICIGHTQTAHSADAVSETISPGKCCIRRSIYAIIHLTALSRTGKFVIIDPLGLTIHHPLWHVHLCPSAYTQLYAGLRRLGFVSFAFRGLKLLQKSDLT
jgi:hypothetical protein